MYHGTSVEVRGQLFKQLALSFQHVGSGDETQAWQQTFHPPNHLGSPQDPPLTPVCVCVGGMCVPWHACGSQWAGERAPVSGVRQDLWGCCTAHSQLICEHQAHSVSASSSLCRNPTMKMHVTRMALCVGLEDETQVAKLVQPVLLLRYFPIPFIVQFL